MTAEGAATLIVAIAVPVLSVAAVWGRISQSTKDLAEGQRSISVKLDLLEEEVRTEIRKMPETYVTMNFDAQRQKWMDERELRFTEALKDIKDELKEIRKGRVSGD